MLRPLGLPRSGGGKQQQPPQQQQQQAAGNVLELRNTDTGRGRSLSVPVCRIALPQGDVPRGPRIKLSLPSFSGATLEVPGLLRYACDLATNVRLVAPCVVTVPPPGRGEEDSPECLAMVLRGRPLVALEFAAMEMRVEEPEALLLAQHGSETVQRWASAKTASLTSAWAAQRA
ncbi:hypothetical protein TSOC_010448 [Tetrabaena socialis]|uniref:Uncharacterized protein n=1 Tax=Tetrabaena socialis TaxID=47790 RepID=A0A2J7ZT97_9CHLO|nr:hypothetical protein TSOC_010448 [Tetrabaena socialis]|eukprot:PNH03497.1 hypothetical protein TSOC_010448 [Tetrabaena socialis]